MNGRFKSVTLLASTYGSLERQLEKALTGVSSEQIVSISYSTTRLFTVFLQHHVLVVIREQ